MPISITNRSEKIPPGPLTMLEMDNDILERMVDFMNALEMLMSISLNADGTLKNPGFFTGASTNGTDTYTATVPGVTVQSGLLGRILILKCDVANSGPATLNVNGYGAFPIMRFQDQTLESDYIKANRYIILTWDGSNYMMQSTPGIVQPANYALDTGVANALVVVKSGWIEIPAALYPGYLIRVKVAAANTGTATITLGALPAVTIKRSDGNNLDANDLTIGKIVDLIYDGINFQAPQLVPIKTMPVSTDSTALSGRVNSNFLVNHNLGATPDHVDVTLICTIDDSAATGYVVGDEIGVESPAQVAGDSQVTVIRNATQVGAAISAGVFNVMHKTTGALVGLTLANWNFKVRASMF